MLPIRSASKQPLKIKKPSHGCRNIVSDHTAWQENRRRRLCALPAVSVVKSGVAYSAYYCRACLVGAGYRNQHDINGAVYSHNIGPPIESDLLSVKILHAS